MMAPEDNTKDEMKEDEDYALLADTIGEMLVMRVAHRKTGMVIYTKRKKIINKAHLRSELYSFREYILERNGLNQAILDYLSKGHGVDTTGKDLKSILDEVSVEQDKKGFK